MLAAVANNVKKKGCGANVGARGLVNTTILYRLNVITILLRCDWWLWMSSNADKPNWHAQPLPAASANAELSAVDFPPGLHQTDVAAGKCDSSQSGCRFALTGGAGTPAIWHKSRKEVGKLSRIGTKMYSFDRRHTGKKFLHKLGLQMNEKWHD